MNFVVYAGKAENMPERADKLYKIFVADEDGEYNLPDVSLAFKKGEILILPPFYRHTASTALKNSTVAVLEKAILPFKAPTKVQDINNITAQAITEAEYFFDKNGEVLNALGNLIAVCVSSFCKKREYSPLVETIRSEIESNISNSAYSVDDTLKRLPLSYEYLRKLFKKETGTTPLCYLSDCRMRLAAQIISSGISNQYSEYTVSQVAEACGFSDPMYFSRVFKKNFGVSPTEYGNTTR
ncbi:MAG: AraC family transcriptional regulator [Clostridiales bacterium]|nr:AraC family transcriptional regulator [Clostridiales bacterium]